MSAAGACAPLGLIVLAGLLSLNVGCGNGRALSRDDVARLKAMPDVHPQVGPPVMARLRFVSGGAKADPDVLALSHLLALPLERATYLPHAVDRGWQRDPAPSPKGPLLDPADALAVRMLDALRGHGVAGRRGEACRAGTCSPELLLDVTVERLELSIEEGPVRAVLPVFEASAALMDPFGRIVFRGRCELSMTARLSTGRDPPLMIQAQVLLDRAALQCGDRLAAELWQAVSPDASKGRSPAADDGRGLQPDDW